MHVMDIDVNGKWEIYINTGYILNGQGTRLWALSTAACLLGYFIALVVSQA